MLHPKKKIKVTLLLENTLVLHWVYDMMWYCSESDSDSDVIADDSEASFSDDNPDYINYQVSSRKRSW